MWNREAARAVGLRCLEARQRAGLTQADLSWHLRDLGVPRAQAEISRLERGMASEREYTNGALLSAIAGLTDVDATWLATGVHPIRGGSEDRYAATARRIRDSWGYYVLFGSRRASMRTTRWNFRGMSVQMLSESRMKLARSRMQLSRARAAG